MNRLLSGLLLECCGRSNDELGFKKLCMWFPAEHCFNGGSESAFYIATSIAVSTTCSGGSPQYLTPPNAEWKVNITAKLVPFEMEHCPPVRVFQHLALGLMPFFDPVVFLASLSTVSVFKPTGRSAKWKNTLPCCNTRKCCTCHTV